MSTHKPVRQSNIELLRIFAMLMVVALHATFETFGYARASAVQAHPGSWLGIITTASACLGSVDLFVLITGWFGTTFRPKGALKLVLQVAYISIIMTLFAWLMDFKLPTKVMDYFRPLWSYWFVCSYLVLYLLTPVFNAFVEKSDERSLRHFLITFYVCVIPASFVFTDLHNGFAAVPFMGLYLLGRYLRLYLAPRLEQVKPWKLLSTWIACIAFMTLLVWGASMIDQSYTTAIIPLYVSYTNPLLIIASASLLLFSHECTFKARQSIGSLQEVLPFTSPISTLLCAKSISNWCVNSINRPPLHSNSLPKWCCSSALSTSPAH